MAKRPFRPKLRRVSTPKSLTYVLIPRDADWGREMYELLYQLVDEHHEELSQCNVRIALAWCTSWKPDVDGRVTLGKCKKASELDRELAPYDFVILLSRDFWQKPQVTALQRKALLDHELMHAAVVHDSETGDPKVDEKGRTLFRIRKHDLEEFEAIARRYGCWKGDIEAFMQAINRAEKNASSGWVGYTNLHEQLKHLGFHIPPTTIASWPDHERREVQTWALLRQEFDDNDRLKAGNATVSVTIPPCLAAAVQELGPAAAGDNTTH